MRAFDQPAYLGLDRSARWLGLVREGLERYGGHYAGSRLANYCPDVYAKAERRLSAWLGAPDVTLLSSGSLAAVLVTGELLGEGYRVLAGPLSHACWRRPGVTSYAEDDAWRSDAMKLISAGERVAVLTDRVCALRCVAADLAWLHNLPQSAAVVVDDSHAIGVLGEGGRASWAEFRELSAELLVSASLGKAFSTPGAVVVGSASRLQALRSTGWFGGASSIPPAYAHALAEGLGDALVQRGALLEHISALAATGLRHAPGHPAFLLDARQAQLLSEAEIAFAKTRYPTAASAEVSRLVVSAAHRRAEVAAVVGVLGVLDAGQKH